MTFKEFLKKYKNRDSINGDFARDVLRDHRFPEENTRSAILSHLYRTCACNEAVKAFFYLWGKYRPEEKEQNKKATTLYRHFNKDGDLLYIGVSLSPFYRTKQHQKAPWHDEIATIKLEHYPDRISALEQELAAIKSENPLYNKRGK